MQISYEFPLTILMKAFLTQSRNNYCLNPSRPQRPRESHAAHARHQLNIQVSESVMQSSRESDRWEHPSCRSTH